MSLLETAKSITQGRKHVNYNMEDVELAVGWLKNEVSSTQVAGAKGQKGNRASIYSYLASALKFGYSNGLLSVKYERKDEDG
jgi:hypothetical protein